MLPPKKQPSETQISQLRAENADLKTRFSAACNTIVCYRSQLESQNRLVFRLLEYLKLPIPFKNDGKMSKDFLASVESALAARENVMNTRKEKDILLEAMCLLLGGKVSLKNLEEQSKHVLTFVLENEDLSREMSFNLSWDDGVIRYESISMHVDETATPKFAGEKCIVFDFDQGPMFLGVVLNAVHDALPHSRKKDSLL